MGNMTYISLLKGENKMIYLKFTHIAPNIQKFK